MALSILVTGANGFVGRTLCTVLSRAGHRVTKAVRAAPAGTANTVAVGDIGPDTDWRAALAGADAVIHLAARAHVMRESTSDPLAAYRWVNVAGTERLARAAADAGVRRFVFASSIKVNGELTRGTPFRESDPPSPQDAYGVSKLEAETGLRSIAAHTGLEVAIVRPPLVYGPGVKGNLARLIRAIERGAPLPLGRIDNRRSLVGVSNLATALAACAEHPNAAGETFLVSDGGYLSTPYLVRSIAHALGKRPRLLPVPVWILKLAARCTGRSSAVARLTGSLQVDSHHIRARLGWQPGLRFEDEIAAMARAWRKGASDIIGD